MKIIAFLLVPLLAIACMPALADPRIDSMFNQCQFVMAQGSCSVALDARNYPPNGTTLISGYGPVSNSIYLYLREARFDKRDAVTYEMCGRILDTCNADFDGPGCHVMRSRYRQTWTPPAGTASAVDRVLAAFNAWIGL